MRIATAMIFQRGVSAMQTRQRELSHSELQLATGRRVVTPEDDPTATARGLDLDRRIATVEQHQRNIDRARERLDLEDTSLREVGNLLQRARELTVQAASDTLAPEDRTAIAHEIRQLRDEVLGLANTRDANGEFLFSGYKGDSRPFTAPSPYTYAGDSGQRRLRISHERTLADSDNGQAVFGGFSDPAGGTRNLIKMLDDLAEDLDAGTPAPPSSQPIQAYLSDLDAGLGRILDIRAQVGARINASDTQKKANEDFLVTMKTTRSEVRDLDYAEAVSRFQQQLTALQASQQSFAKIQDLSLFKFI